MRNHVSLYNASPTFNSQWYTERAKELGLAPKARIVAYASGGLDPAYMGAGPVPKINLLSQVAAALNRPIQRV